jgi:outer membrane receptor for ferrienterochelin and colicins
MKTKILILIAIIAAIANHGYAQRGKTDATIVGHIESAGKHIPFATISIKGTSIGVSADATGHFLLTNLPEGDLIIVASATGYKTKEIKVSKASNTTTEVNFEMEVDVLDIDEVVVSADRSAQKRTESPVIVSSLSPKIFEASNSATLGEGLMFTPGLRLENNCQNCGFTQVRMNGLEGPYSQILINSRPIFSGLAGVYGLELIPANMIDRVEIVRGGGSAAFGGNAIAGTINVILKEPASNNYEASASYGLIGAGMDETAGDLTLSLNTSIVGSDRKTGLAIYGFKRERDVFDANGDGFSEMSELQSMAVGTRLHRQLGNRGKLTADYMAINENREGGNKHDHPLHQRDIAEAVRHDLQTAALSYERYFRSYDMLSVFGSGQFLKRDSYYGADLSMSDYGYSTDNTYNAGAQYRMAFEKASFTLGLDNTNGSLEDYKLGYPDFENAALNDEGELEITNVPSTLVCKQNTNVAGIFTQYDVKMGKTKLAAGARLDRYDVRDLSAEPAPDKEGIVFIPRISIMQELAKPLQARISYAQGYRAPQMFDEDLHIETSGARKVINENHPDLKQETSHSFMASLDFNGLVGTVNTGLLVEGFYTMLVDPFQNEIGEPDENGTVIYTRKNAKEGATVQGVNIELKIKPLKQISFSSGFTIQSSMFNEAEEEFGERRFFRTPNNYGYGTIDLDISKNFCIMATSTYTGKMLMPYFGPEAEEGGELRETGSFFDLGLKLEYKVAVNGTVLKFFGGAKNIFNSFQSDFDKGTERDPAYVYGPLNPRTIYLGIKIGNLL